VKPRGEQILSFNKSAQFTVKMVMIFKNPLEERHLDEKFGESVNILYKLNDG
jgi:hypothetical protein